MNLTVQTKPKCPLTREGEKVREVSPEDRCKTNGAREGGAGGKSWGKVRVRNGNVKVPSHDGKGRASGEGEALIGAGRRREWGGGRARERGVARGR